MIKEKHFSLIKKQLEKYSDEELRSLCKELFDIPLSQLWFDIETRLPLNRLFTVKDILDLGNKFFEEYGLDFQKCYFDYEFEDTEFDGKAFFLKAYQRHVFDISKPKERKGLILKILEHIQKTKENVRRKKNAYELLHKFFQEYNKE